MDVQVGHLRSRTKQHSLRRPCLKFMARKRTRSENDGRTTVEESSVYGSGTPIWNKYYQQVRKRVKFPRYYKKALNW